jgi:hypothetical protein
VTRRDLELLGVKPREIADLLQQDRTSISRKLDGKLRWSLDDAHAIVRYLKLQHRVPATIETLFPGASS